MLAKISKWAYKYAQDHTLKLHFKPTNTKGLRMSSEVSRFPTKILLQQTGHSRDNKIIKNAL